MHKPADIDRQLLRFGAWQQHAIVQRVEEPRLAYPAFLDHQDAVHDGNLARRAAETEERDAHPGPKGFTQRGEALRFFRGGQHDGIAGGGQAASSLLPPSPQTGIMGLLKLTFHPVNERIR
jgi:hypothetical protein